MNQKNKILTAILFFAGILLATALFGWFLIKRQMPETPKPDILADAAASPEVRVTPEPTAEAAMETAAVPEPEEPLEPPVSEPGSEAVQVENVVLCGQNLKFPMTLQNLTEQGFTYAPMPEREGNTERWMDVYYQGKKTSMMKMDKSSRILGLVVGYEEKDSLKYVSAATGGETEGSASAEDSSQAAESGDSARKTGDEPESAVSGGEKTMEEILGELAIAGKKLTFPLTVKSLIDQGFSYEAANKLSKKDRDWSFVLLNQGKRIALMGAHARKKKAGLGKRMINFIQFDYSEGGMEDFELCGMSGRTSRGEIQNLWGKGEEMPWGLRYVSGANRKTSIELYFSRKGKLNSVYIYLN